MHVNKNVFALHNNFFISESQRDRNESRSPDKDGSRSDLSGDHQCPVCQVWFGLQAK